MLFAFWEVAGSGMALQLIFQKPGQASGRTGEGLICKLCNGRNLLFNAPLAKPMPCCLVSHAQHP